MRTDWRRANSLFSKYDERAQKKEITDILASNRNSHEGRNISSFVRLYVGNEFRKLFRPISWLKGLKAEGKCILFVQTFFYYKRIYIAVKSVNSQPTTKHATVYSCEYTQYKKGLTN